FWLALEVLAFFFGAGTGRWLDGACRAAEADPQRAYNAIAPFLLLCGGFYFTLIAGDMLGLSALTIAPDDPSRAVLSAFAGNFWPMLAVLCGASAALRAKHMRILPWLALAVLLIAAFALGRRIFLMAAALAVIAYAWMRDWRPGALARWAALLLA